LIGSDIEKVKDRIKGEIVEEGVNVDEVDPEVVRYALEALGQKPELEEVMAKTLRDVFDKKFESLSRVSKDHVNTFKKKLKKQFYENELDKMESL
jgi:Arc/MetJ-type ribon-helix-helix transcriptional regulator